MDPITAAIMAALSAIASGLVESSVKDGYEGLKALIRRKWGDASSVAKSVDALEATSDSKGLEGSGCRPRREYQSSQSYRGCRRHTGVGQAPR